MSQSVFCATYWKSSARITTYKLCVMGILVALQILLSRITAISLGNWLRISFGFLPNAVAGYLFGPVGGLLVAVDAEEAEALLSDLRAAGAPAAIVGEVTDSEDIEIRVMG